MVLLLLLLLFFCALLILTGHILIWKSLKRKMKSQWGTIWETFKHNSTWFLGYQTTLCRKTPGMGKIKAFVCKSKAMVADTGFGIHFIFPGTVSFYHTYILKQLSYLQRPQQCAFRQESWLLLIISWSILSLPSTLLLGSICRLHTWLQLHCTQNQHQLALRFQNTDLLHPYCREMWKRKLEKRNFQDSILSEHIVVGCWLTTDDCELFKSSTISMKTTHNYNHLLKIYRKRNF